MKYDKKKLDVICEHLSKREQLSAKAQRDSIKYKQAEYLQDKVGMIYEGIVSGMTEWGMYVELTENKCEGMIRISDISKDEKFKVNMESYSVVGTKTGRIISLGDIISVSISGVNLEKKTIDFKINEI